MACAQFQPLVNSWEKKLPANVRFTYLPATGGGMTVPFGRVIAQMLMAVFDGFSAFEMVYQKPKGGPLKNKWTLKKLAHRPSEQLTFLLDDRSEFTGLRQQTMYHDQQIDVVIPADNVCYYAANEEERPFYGMSYFNVAYKHWEAKFKLYVVAHIQHSSRRAAPPTQTFTSAHPFQAAYLDWPIEFNHGHILTSACANPLGDGNTRRPVAN